MTRTLLPALAAALLLVPTASAQQVPRFGVAAQGLVAVPDGIGLGLRGRAAMALNDDVSLAGDVGGTAFLIGLKSKADYAFELQGSVIINTGPAQTLADPVGSSTRPYLLAGLGGYFPAGDSTDSKGGLTIHGGVGWIAPLNQSSIFYEVNPAIVFRGKNRLGVLLPVRVGLIF